MKKLLALTALIVSWSPILSGGEISQLASTGGQSRDWFDGGAFELELMSGVAGAPIRGNHITYHFTDTELRLGWMLYAPHGAGLFRGNLELLGAVGGGGIFKGPGSVFGTLGAILRYNFVQPSARLVPYFQIGAAAFGSDISENKRQQDIGGTFEADLNAGVGMKLLMTPRWSLGTELFFEHVSNANTDQHNVGINALGGLVGISRSF